MKTHFNFIEILAMTALVSILAPSAQAGDWDIGADSRMRSEALYAGRVQSGTVLQVRQIEVEPSTGAKTVSTGLGAVLGGALGSQFGKGDGKYVAGTIGGLLGGIAGNMTGEVITSAKAQEIIIKKDDGSIIVITQSESSLYAGQKVFLVESLGKIRVIQDMTGIAARM